MTTSGGMPTQKRTMTTSLPYHCPGCGAQIGQLVPDNETVKLDSNGWLISDGKKYCHRCGRPVHFKSPRETWSEMVERLKRRSDGNRSAA